MPKQRNVLLILLLLAASQAHSDELTDAAQSLCKNVQGCAVKQFSQQEMTPEMRAMMRPMLDNMCANVQKKIGEVPPGEFMRMKAVACMRSMATLPCDALQAKSRVETPECEAFDTAGKEMEALSPDTSNSPAPQVSPSKESAQ
jgi:hypothetical protein